MSRLLGSTSESIEKISIWSELLNNVSSGIPGESVAVNSEEGEISLPNGEYHPGVGGDISIDGAKYKSKHILIIGDNDSGKTSLLSLLKGSATSEKSVKGSKALVKSGYALDYYYIDIQSEELDMEEVRKCSMWVLRGSSGVQSLLQSAYSAQMVPHTLFTVVLDFSQPWKLKQSLESAVEHIQSIISQLQVPEEVLASMRTRLQRRFQTYCDNEAESKLKSSASSSEELLPLGEGILTDNLGVPIMVICTKLDSIAELEKLYKYNDEHFDYIQQFLRNQCLKHGASLAYTSSKDARCLPSLYKLILNSLFEVLPKSGSLASVVEKDSIFVPIGWDNLLKIKTVQDNLIGDVKVDDAFEDVCRQPPQSANKRNAQQEVTGTPLMPDEEQMFLNRSQAALQKPVQTGSSSIMTPMRGTSSPGVRTPLATTANGGEANLQQFFNSLLNSGKSRSSAPGTGSGLSSPSRNSAMSTPDQRRMTAPPKSIPPANAAPPAPTPAAATTNGASEA